MQDQCFISHPYQIELIESDFQNWVETLRKKIDNYKPDKSTIVDVPKKNWHIRPGHILTIEDHVIYSALVLDGIQQIRNEIKWSDNKKRFSHILKKDQSDKDWFEFPLNSWESFRKETLKLFENGYKWGVFYDISAFFENIDIDTLIKDLYALKFPEDSLNLLKVCLHQWAHPPNKGIPQSHSESFILSNVYLNSIDKRQENDGILCLRYADDGRILCKTQRDAVESLHHLTRLLREKGLNLQTAKTKIQAKKDAITEMKMVRDNINKITKDIKSEVAEYYDLNYTTPSELKVIFEKFKKEINIRALETAFDEFCVKLKTSFEKTIFHFILNRLSVLEDPIAVDFCIDMIIARPEETDFILNNYFSKLKKGIKKIIKRVVTLMESNSLIYEFQKYLIIKWLYNVDEEGIALKSICATWKGNIHLFTKDYCIAYIGKFGNETYLDTIKDSYTSLLTDMERATIICSINRMSKMKRNSFYGSVQGTGYYIDLALKWAKTHT